jgi:ubiquinone/menaquinone biosynthesis C-methylase UbiE
MKNLILLIIAWAGLLFGNNKPYEIWWQEKLADPKMMRLFQSWLGNLNAPSRIVARNYIMDRQYKSILDVGCGLCTELEGYRKSGYSIEYIGIDITERLVENSKKSGINCMIGSAENIPLPDRVVDVVYARHLLEHLNYYEKALLEMIRCARREVIVVFFIKPQEKDDTINYGQHYGYYLYHNCYDKRKLENFVSKISRVKAIEWQNVNLTTEKILHIVLED